MALRGFQSDRRTFLKASLYGAVAAGVAACESGSRGTDDRVNGALGQLDQIVTDTLAKTGAPGLAVGVVYRGKLVYAKGFGKRDLSTGAPIDADTVFQLASVSKAVGASVIARLVGQGKVRWDMPIVDKLSWFALKDAAATAQLTVADMYSHRSGLPGHAGDRLEDIGFDQRTVLERLRYLSLKPFRQEYAYTNFGMTVGGLAVAEAVGSDWATLSEQMIYAPLGMSSTSSRFADYLARPNRASGHQRVNGQWAVRSPQRMPDAQAPAASVTSSVNDMAKWMMLILQKGAYQGQRVIEEAALEPAISQQMKTDTGGYYGYGFNVGTNNLGQRTLSHSGAFAMGASTSFRMVPELELGIVCLCNGFPIGVPEAVDLSFTDLAVNGTLTKDWFTLAIDGLKGLTLPEGSLVGVAPPASPAPARALAEYAGTYANDYHGPAEITVVGNALQLKLGGAPLVRPLAHWDGDVFTFTLDDENGPPGTISKASFAGNQVTLEHYDHEQLGTFTK